ncbi:hypothetical protein ACFE04_026461 [Oxalis oulophora]
MPYNHSYSDLGSGSSARDTARADSSSLPLNSRRSTALIPYKLKWDKETLNSRLGPSDFFPQAPNCPEETLNREYVQSGYRETVEGLEDAREISLSQVQAFTKPVVLRCREAIKKCHRAIQESRAQKRKAGQVYGIPLSGSLLTKHALFPEQRPSSEDFRKKWIEALSQPHKRLRSLADPVPHGYRKKSLFDTLIKNNVPLLRASWFIKVTYLNQVRPGSASISSGALDKSQLSRTELWTKDVVEYLQSLLDESFSRNNQHSRDRSSQMLYTGSSQHRTDILSVVLDGEVSLQFKWWYVVRLVQWHLLEGLLLPSLIVDWVFNQLQEKELLEVLQFLLPIIYGLIETIVQCQTYIRNLVGMAIRFICEPSPGGSDVIDNSRRAYTKSALVEMLRYLVLAVPDTFVALDCFPLPQSVLSYALNDRSFASKASEHAGKTKSNSEFRFKGTDAKYQSLCFDHVVSTIHKHADKLRKSATPGYPGHSVAKAVHALDKALLQGDVKEAYELIFENLCDGVVNERWISEVSPCLRSSLKWFGSVNQSFVCSVFVLCEWATSDFRDFRTVPPHDVKFTGEKDFSQIYIAIQLLKIKNRALQSSSGHKSEKSPGVDSLPKGQGQQSNHFSWNNVHKSRNHRKSSQPDIFESPGPLHDIIVCWIDQHDVQKKEGLKCLQLFISELVRSGIFYPQAYVRQLIIGGIMDTNGAVTDVVKRKRHYQVLKQLPGKFMRDTLEEANVVESLQLLQAMEVYINERRLILGELLRDRSKMAKNDAIPVWKQPPSVSRRKNIQSLSVKNYKSCLDVEELKAAISVLLQLPSSSTATESAVDESQESSVKKHGRSVVNKQDFMEVTPVCDDCKRSKRRKLNDGKSSSLQVSPVLSDDEGSWWVKKGVQPLEPAKVNPPVKVTKQVSRGRQKIVRKTQSLAQLAASRIENSQGASASHVCDNKVSCPHHRADGENLKSVDGIKTDIVSIGKALKKLRFIEKRTVTVWLTSAVRQLVEETEKTVTKVDQFGRPSISTDDKSSVRWKLGEDELSMILYLLDVCNDLVSAVKFLLWLLPKALNVPSSTIHSGRNMLMMPRNAENNVCDVGEAFLLASLHRYENILTATNLIPEALSASMHRAAAVMAANGRISGSAALAYGRYLLKKYGNVVSVIDWEKFFKATCDKKLFSELESGRSLDRDTLGVPSGVENLDDYFRQKMSGGRISRVAVSMREVVQRHVDEAFTHFITKERKAIASGTQKSPAVEKWDDGYHISQQIIMGLMDCIRQTGGAAQEGDPSLVSSAVSAIVGNVGPSIVTALDFTASNNFSNHTSLARCILLVHITCLRLLKEALGDRHARVFEIALGIESCTALAGKFSPGKVSNEVSNSSAKLAHGKSTRTMVAAVSALVIGAVIHGVIGLERLVTVLKLNEGLDVIQFVRGTKSNSNGNARAFKVDNWIEVYVHWFRLLIGNCRTISDGLVVELLGEPSIVALSRMQRMLPINLVFPPAYSIYAFVTWKSFILYGQLAAREDMLQLYQSLTISINDAIKHMPFRDVCLRDTQGLYDLMAADPTDAEFAALMELNNLDMQLKAMAIVPSRARLFLNAIIDCKIPHSKLPQDNGKRVSGVQHGENETKLLDKLVQVLDTLQPAKLHWQWVELRLLLNEQALVEKLENHDMPLVDAIRSSSPTPEKAAASENENNFIEILLTRLLVRPDATPLFSEVIHLFGRSLEDSMLLQARWFFGGADVLFGRKTIRQRLINIAESKGLSTKPQFWKPWGWTTNSVSNSLTNKRDRKKFEATSIEDGEVVEGGTGSKKYSKGSQLEAQVNVTEKALIELVLPCIDQSSDELRNAFANDLIKQLSKIEQQINAVTPGAIKQTGAGSSGVEGSTIKGNSRKGIRGGSPGLARRAAGESSALLSPTALRASMALRLQLLLRLMPVIYADSEPSVRNMRHMLALVILRLLGNRVVYEDVDLTYGPIQSIQSKREMETVMAVSLDFSGEYIFDRLLFVLHGLLSSCQPSWLRSTKRSSKSTNESSKDLNVFDREVAESLQKELDRMQLPDEIRWRIQASMPVLFPSLRCSLSCQPQSVPNRAIALLQSSTQTTSTPNPPQKNSSRGSTNQSGKSRSLPLPPPPNNDNDMEIDPWTLLEDGTGSGQSAANAGSADHANLKASSWLKGTVRVRRTDLTYIGSMDDES